MLENVIVLTGLEHGGGLVAIVRQPYRSAADRPPANISFNRVLHRATIPPTIDHEARVVNTPYKFPIAVAGPKPRASKSLVHF